MVVLCYRCKHFIGLDVDGNVHCSRRGKTRPMIICRYFEEENREEDSHD